MLENCIILMAKQPAPGLAKTRLAATLGSQAAAELASAFLLDTVELAHSVSGAAAMISFTPPSARPRFSGLLRGGDHLQQQGDGNLGDRLSEAFAAAFDLGARRAIAIATDSPSVPAEFLANAFTALRRHRVVIGPAEDGGYYLIGMSRYEPLLFEGVSWSTERVYAQTMARTRQLRLRAATLPAWYDVDDGRSLERLRADIDSGAADCPNTAMALDTVDNARRRAG